MKDVSHTLSIIFLSGIKHSNQKAEIRRLDNTEFETKKKISTREKGKHILFIKVLTHQEDIIIINIYKPSNKGSKCRWQYLKKCIKKKTIQQ